MKLGETMATLWKKANSVNYYYKFMVNGKTYQATTGKSNRVQAQRTANKIEAEIKQSLNWKVAYDRLQDALKLLPPVEQMSIRRDLAQDLLKSTGKTLPVAKAYERWLKVPKARTQSEKTLKDYISIWGHFQTYLSDTYPDIQDMHEITKGIAEKYMTFVWDENVTERTYNKKLTFIKGLFDKLKDQIGFPDNPFESIPKKQGFTVSREPFTLAQIDKLLGAAKGEYKTLIYLGANLGARLADAARMRWDNVDFDKNEIIFTPEKTDVYQKEVQIPIFPPLREHLESLSRNDELITPAVAALYESDPPKVSKTITEIIKSIGIKETKKKRKDGRGQASSIYGFHSLRHSFISTCKNNEIPQHVVMAWVAHSSEAVNAIYTHIDNAASHKFAKKMEDGE
jgi:integrase